MKKIRVAVVAGGISNEREVSLKTGENVFEGLQRLKRYEVSFLEITKQGKWEWRTSLYKKSKKIWSGEFPEKRVFQKEADIFFIGLHGAFGEDGRIQALFDWLGVKYTGSGMTASAIGMDKQLCSELVSRYGVRIPKTLKCNLNDVRAIRKKLKQAGITLPCVAKPNDSGSSVGVTIIKKWAQLEKATKEAFQHSSEIMIQQFVKGREFSCAALGNVDKKATVLPPVEIVTHGTAFFDYHAKYLSNETEEICPAPIEKNETRELKRITELAHMSLGCDGLTRSDFIYDEQDKKFYFLEINTLPGLTAASICPKEARAVGLSFEQFLKKIVELGLQKRKQQQ